MRFRTFILFTVLALTAVFALINWDAFTAPSTVSLIFGTVQVPIGLVMLGVVLVLGLMSLAYLIYVQGTALAESRRYAKELQAQRELVDKVEASRFTELHNFVNNELRTVAQMNADMQEKILGRLDLLEQHTRTAVQETGNSLSAYIGELEDRMEHRAGPNGGSSRDDPLSH